jgi:predicted enzyme related to lactoylglutathione lyase
MRHQPGTFGWTDLSTGDLPAAVAFYSSLFGWQAEPVPTRDSPGYTMMRKGGLLVAGMTALPPAAVAAGAPATWNSYVMVDDIEQAVATASAAGGRVLLAPIDVGDGGRMAMLADPSGAGFGVGQQGGAPGAELTRAAGAVIWNELQSRDIDRALPFYRQLFGWQWSDWRDTGYAIALPTPDADPERDGIAGAMPMPDGVPPMAPSMWQVYFGVTDCDTAAAAAVDLGGSVFVPRMEMGGMNFVGLVDPSGGMFFAGDF